MGNPRYRHSFPTRRSSDLLDVQLFGGTAIDVVGDPLPGETLAACMGADGVCLGAVGGPQWANGVRPESGDRKSTRLNSSHVEISYAVFCLKKKMKTT